MEQSTKNYLVTIPSVWGAILVALGAVVTMAAIISNVTFGTSKLPFNIGLGITVVGLLLSLFGMIVQTIQLSRRKK